MKLEDPVDQDDDEGIDWLALPVKKEEQFLPKKKAIKNFDEQPVGIHNNDFDELPVGPAPSKKIMNDFDEQPVGVHRQKSDQNNS